MLQSWRKSCNCEGTTSASGFPDGFFRWTQKNQQSWFWKNVMCLCASFNWHGHHILQVSSHRRLGIIFHHCLSRSSDSPIDHVVLKALTKLGFLRHMANCLVPLVIRDIYMYCILPAAEHAREMWLGLSTTDSILFEKLNGRAARFILKVPSSSQISQDHDILLARACLQLISIQRKLLRQATSASSISKLGFQPQHPKLAIAMDNWLPASKSS